jgi:hypothetical protein
MTTYRASHFVSVLETINDLTTQISFLQKTKREWAAKLKQMTEAGAPRMATADAQTDIQRPQMTTSDAQTDYTINPNNKYSTNVVRLTPYLSNP